MTMSLVVQVRPISFKTKECYIIRNIGTRSYLNKAFLSNHNCEISTCLMFVDLKNQASGFTNPDVWRGSVCVTEAELFVSFT